MKQFRILLSVSMFTLFGTYANAATVNMAPIISYLLSDTAPAIPTAEEVAIAKIGAYADDQNQPTPTVQDYTDAGATVVDANHLDTINNAIAGLTASDVDTTEEIQAVIDANSNAQPVANAGSLQEVLTSGIVTLDANSSADTDGDVLTYLWEIVTKPLDSNAALSDTTSIYPTFLADKAGTYDFSLVVNDGNLNSESDTVSIIASHTAGVLNATFDADGIVVHNRCCWRK
ncbi:MAG: PKD domain-containing protein [Sulfurovum sp.]|nr:PKD domain-containing protein [Sulfurovum sp.]